MVSLSVIMLYKLRNSRSQNASQNKIIVSKQDSLIL